MALVAQGKASRERSGESSGASADERRGRAIIAASIVQDLGAREGGTMKAPQWPAQFRSAWSVVLEDASNPSGGSEDRLASFGDFRAAVTLAEHAAAGSVRTLLQAWRDLVDFDGSALAEACGAKVRAHLRAEFNLKIGAPPPARHIANVAARSTRRYDLLPPNMREVGAW